MTSCTTLGRSTPRCYKACIRTRQSQLQPVQIATEYALSKRIHHFGGSLGSEGNPKEMRESRYYFQCVERDILITVTNSLSIRADVRHPNDVVRRNEV